MSPTTLEYGYATPGFSHRSRVARYGTELQQAIDIYEFLYVDLTAGHHYSGRQNKATQYTPMADNQLQVLEQKIDELIALCDQLNRENQALKADSAGWQRERQDLMDKNELARTRVEAMINRLRTME